MLGGRVERVPSYASGGYYRDEKGHETLRGEMRRYLNEGHDAVKMKIGRLSAAEEADRVAAVRDEIGSDVDLAFDCHWDYSVESPKRLAYELKPFDLIYEHGADVVTPDPTTVGGLTETMRIADRAEENYSPMSPHNVCSPAGTMACVHLGAAVPNFDLLEYHALEVDWWDDLLVREEPLIQDGTIAVPEAPGLGIELDESVVETHRLEGTTGF